MALGGVTQLINGLNSGIHSRVVADGILTAGNIIVNGAGQADAGNSLICQRTGAHEGAVTANDDQCVNAQLLAAGKALCLTFLRFEFKAARRVQDRAAAVDDLGHAAHIHLIHFAVDQAVITTLDTHHAVSLADACTDNRTHCSVHAGCVTATGENTDRFDFLSHKASPSYSGTMDPPETSCFIQAWSSRYNNFLTNS